MQHAGLVRGRGVDLVIDEFRAVFSPDHPIDAETGLPWVQLNDSVTVRYRVRNRGDQASLPFNAFAEGCGGCDESRREVPIRALAPGAVDSGVLKLAATHGNFGTVAPLMNLNGGGPTEDLFYLNNVRTSSQSYLNVVPDLRVTVQVPSEVRVGTPLRMVVTARNHARLSSYAADSMSFCIPGGFGLGCVRFFGTRAMPAIGPNQEWRDTVEVQFTPELYATEKHNAFVTPMFACLNAGKGRCLNVGNVFVRPNLELVCAMPEITPGVAIEATTAPPCYSYMGNYVVYSFHARAGERYRVTVTSSASGFFYTSLWTSDGDRISVGSDRFTEDVVPVDGKHYVVLRPSVGPFTVLLERVE